MTTARGRGADGAAIGAGLREGAREGPRSVERAAFRRAARGAFRFALVGRFTYNPIDLMLVSASVEHVVGRR
jgi:hypothetical protein